MFEYEKQEMEPLALKKLPEYYPGHCYFTEFQFTDSPGPGRYRADIVLAEYNHKKLSEWMYKTAPATSPPPPSYEELRNLSPIDIEEYK